jgi:hypothetical protein
MASTSSASEVVAVDAMSAAAAAAYVLDAPDPLPVKLKMGETTYRIGPTGWEFEAGSDAAREAQVLSDRLEAATKQLAESQAAAELNREAAAALRGKLEQSEKQLEGTIEKLALVQLDERKSYEAYTLEAQKVVSYRAACERLCKELDAAGRATAP